MNFSDLIIDLYKLAETVKDDQISFKIKMLSNALAKLGNEYMASEKNPENNHEIL